MLVDGRPLASDFARGTAYGKLNFLLLLQVDSLTFLISGTDGRA